MTPPTSTETPTETPTEAPAQEAGADEATLLGGAVAKAPEGGEGDPAEAEKPVGAPEAYEITLKDAEGNDVPLDADLMAEAEPLLREVGLSNEAANKLAPFAPRLMEIGAQRAEAANEQLLAQTKRDWLDQFKASELGGAKEAETLHVASKGMDALGFKEGHPFRELLNVSGIGNHPDMITTFYRLGSLLSEEGTFADPDGASETKTVGWADRYKA